jgi:ribose transport system substrate-binding protein
MNTKYKFKSIIIVCAVVLIASACASPATPEPAKEEQPEVESGTSCKYGENGKCKVVLVNSFVGNDWRVQMQNSATAAGKKEPFLSEWDFSILNTENTAEAQNAAVENLIAQGVDALLYDAVSDTSADDVIKRACDAGIKVVSFDVTSKVDACQVRIELDFYTAALASGRWFGHKLDCQGNVIMDKGMQGVSLAEDIYRGNIDGMKEICDDKINIVGEYYGNFAATEQEPQISALLSTNPDVQAVLGEADVVTIASAFKAAGLNPPAMRGAGSNANMVACLEPGVECFLSSNTPSVSIGAMDVAYKLLHGEDVPKIVPYPIQHFATDTSFEVGEPYEKIEEGVNAFPDLPPGFQPAYNWPGAMVTITLDEAMGK